MQLGFSMKKLINTRLKKIIAVTSVVIIITVAVVILFISPITKYLVEKYDVQYTGRQITMDWAYVNPFTGYVHFSNFKIYELNSLPTGQAGDSVFFSAKGLSMNIAM